ncbi:MAG: Ig-like domain-containing protein [Bacteroidetes bacterium]|nr:Ig-like domain-containing protein [Bacteroidota bacterium]
MKSATITLFLMVAANAYSQKNAEIIWENSKSVGVVIPGISNDNFEVRLKGADSKILGKTAVKDGSNIFYPLWAFTQGLTYEVISEGALFKSFSVPEDLSEDVPEIVSVYPTIDVIPENLLKMYVVFSQRMNQGYALDFIHIRNKTTFSVEYPFLDLQPELWNKDGTILTLWLDPGRIKRDLGPNKIYSTPVDEGESYEMVISKYWKSTMGSQLKDSFSRSFKVAANDREKPMPENWRITSPRANSVEQLTIDFGESMDYLLAMNAITVSKNEVEVPGQISLNKDESVWRFTPNQPWNESEYQIVVETRLEDLAGNNLNRPFDRDTTQEEAEEGAIKIIPFTPGL